MEFLLDVCDEMEILLSDGPAKPGDTWELGEFDNWAIIAQKEGLFLIMPIGSDGIQIEPYTYREVKMPAMRIDPKKAQWVDQSLFEEGMRDGYLTPFMVKRLWQLA